MKIHTQNKKNISLQMRFFRPNFSMRPLDSEPEQTIRWKTTTETETKNQIEEKQLFV
jgi:hypothetical protein